MKIFDLTRRKYSELFDEPYRYNMEYESSIIAAVQKCENRLSILKLDNIVEKLNEIISGVPIILVETSMADEYVPVPGYQCAVRVPVDKSLAYVEDGEFDIEEWVRSKENEEKDDPRERRSLRQFISDLFGIYVYTDEQDILPRRIFVWMDKIVAYAKDNSKNGGRWEDNAIALFDLVIFHELAHAIMDVELYGKHPSPNFSYERDYVYRYIEEAYANAFALTVIYEQIMQKSFIEDFVLHQGAGYAKGWDVYQKDMINLGNWLDIKINFNSRINRLKKFWKDKDFGKLKGGLVISSKSPI